MVEQQGF